MLLILCVLLLSLGLVRGDASAVELHLRVAVPQETPADAEVYLAGDFQGWNPADPASRLTRTPDGRYEITLELPAGRVEFEFTRGSWATVEKGPQGEEIGHRVLTVAAPARFDLTVARWADLGAPRTLTGDVTEVTVPGFLDGRRVWVYLPPQYHRSTRAYPVLLMLDGQNVFDVSTSFAGEWEVDETCERLIAAGEIEPLIVVAIDNGRAQRIFEYTPWPDPQRSAGGGGAAHLRAIVDVLLPWIRTHYRALDGPENTGFSGSSLGGLMSLYAAYAEPSSFGRIGALSPTLFWADHEILRYVGGQPRPAGSRMWIDMGTLESNTPVDHDGNGVDDSIDGLRQLCATLTGQGWTLGQDLRCFEDEGAHHQEASWAARFDEVLRFLFPPQTGVSSPAETTGTSPGSRR